MWRTEDTYLRSSFAFCTAANAAALTLDASKPDGSAHTRHIGQFAGWSRYEAGTWGRGESSDARSAWAAARALRVGSGWTHPGGAERLHEVVHEEQRAGAEVMKVVEVRACAGISTVRVA